MSQHSLAGLIPGHSTMGDAVAAFGTVYRCVESSGNERCRLIRFDTFGVQATVQWTDDPDDTSLIIQEVAVYDGFTDTVWGGLRIGAATHSAYALIRSRYTVLDEYEDSIYFQLDDDVRFVSVAEDRMSGELIELELLFYPNGYNRG